MWSRSDPRDIDQSTPFSIVILFRVDGVWLASYAIVSNRRISVMTLNMFPTFVEWDTSWHWAPAPGWEHLADAEVPCVAQASDAVVERICEAVSDDLYSSNGTHRNVKIGNATMCICGGGPVIVDRIRAEIRKAAKG